jgi:RNA polymerase sigma factor for flagellar operon FliA
LIQLTAEQQDVVEKNLPLVEHIVKRLMSRFPACYDRDDLVQTGIIGLMEAAGRFDPTKGIAFSTFVGRRIEGAIIDQLRRDDWAPRSVRASERQLEQAEAELMARHGRRPDEETLSQRLELDVAELRRLRARIASASIDSLDRPVGRDEGTSPLGETVADASGLGVEGDLDDRELRGYLRDALSLLPERHRIIIVGHFFEGRSMTELGELLGVTQSRASQLKEDALRMVRQAIRSQYLEPQGEATRSTKREREFTESVRRAKTWRERIVPAQSILVG